MSNVLLVQLFFFAFLIVDLCLKHMMILTLRYVTCLILIPYISLQVGVCGLFLFSEGNGC